MKSIKNKNLIIALGILTALCLNSGRAMATDNSASDNTDFTVSIPENITVTVTTPTGGVSGSVGEFLRNLVTVNVVSNNQYGFETTMNAKTTTVLTNTDDSSVTIPTLTAATTQANFGNNYWGYSLDDGTTVSGTSTYSPISTSAISLSSASASSATSVSEDIYFGMKADVSQVAGTYKNTIVIAVVGKVDGGGTETDPTPVDDDDNPEIIADEEETDGGTTIRTITKETDYTNNTTQRETTTTTTTDSTTTTEKSTSSYATPQGVVSSETASSSVNVGMIVAGTVAVLSTTGLIFVMVRAKRDNDDEDDDEDY